MELLVFGHGGARVLVFPTSQGRYYEWEDRGMVRALGEHLERGWLQLFCLDSVDAESWYDRGKHPHDRARRHLQYEGYVLHEVLPLTRRLNPQPFLITTGASFGAYHALNLAFRHPWAVGRVIGLSGLYDIKRLTDGYEDELVYQNCPSHFMVHEGEGPRLRGIRELDTILVTGEEDAFRADNEHLSGVLWSKGVWHALRIWDGWCHDWPWWQEMIRRYVGGAD